ncbi:MAG: hypothetical protein JNM80_03875 [Phycisphaerae bacterium]|nr:hypothetical protein [Phycisphaerae bacterium]
MSVLVLSAPCLAGPIITPASAAPRYTYTVIGGLPQSAPAGPLSMSLSVNSSGRVVGYGATAPGYLSALSWKSGNFAPLSGVSGFNQTFARDVNNTGRVVGGGYKLGPNGGILETHALRWIGTQVTNLGNLGGMHALALAVNDTGYVVGYSTLPGDNQTRAFIWHGGPMQALTTLPGAIESYAYDISNTGYVVGTAASAAATRPFLWKDGRAVELPIPAGVRAAAANAVNDAGHAVGAIEISLNTGEFGATLWRDGQRIDLGNLGGGFNYAIASGINNSGAVVGTSNSPGGLTGFLWIDGVMHNLRDLVAPGLSPLTIISASGIGDGGQISATAIVNGKRTAVLLNPLGPIPSPGVWTLVTLGLLAATRRRR